MTKTVRIPRTLRVLAAEGFAVALLNPMRTRRFAGEDLARAKTDAIDAVGIAWFGAQKRPAHRGGRIKRQNK